MLRNRSRAVTGKQALMADQTSQSSSSSSSSSPSSYTKPLQNSFFGSPRFKAFSSTTTTTDHHSIISPTSVLDSKPFFSLQNPFKTNPNSPKTIFPENKHKPSEPKKPIGLALIEEKNDCKPTKSVIFSAKLRVQIPPLGTALDGGGGEMGNALLMTVKEMELCEEYTCVKRHGPNAKITHIFYNSVVKSFVDNSSSHNFSTADVRKKKKKNNNNFLSFCYTCKNDLQLTNDIYIYRGEKAFCSHECRNQEMLLDEEEEDSC